MKTIPADIERPSQAVLHEAQRELCGELGESKIVSDPDILVQYSEDWSFSGQYMPDLVIRPTCAVDVQVVFQVATNSVVIRVGSRKRFCRLALGTVRLLRTGIAALPFLVTLGIDRPLLLKPLGMLMLLSGVFGMSAEVVRQSWIADLVPASLRGRFFGRRVQIAGGVTMVTILAYAWFIDAWQSFGHDSLGAFQIVIGFGAGAGFASLWYIWQIPEPPPHGKQSQTSFLTSLALPGAIEACAAASAGPSLMPSPTMSG